MDVLKSNSPPPPPPTTLSQCWKKQEKYGELNMEPSEMCSNCKHYRYGIPSIFFSYCKKDGTILYSVYRARECPYYHRVRSVR